MILCVTKSVSECVNVNVNLNVSVSESECGRE